MTRFRTPDADSSDAPVTEESEGMWGGKVWVMGLLLISLVLVVVGAWAALGPGAGSAALGTGRSGSMDLVELRRGFEKSRSMVLQGWPERSAGPLVHRWRQRGLTVGLGGSVPVDPAPVWGWWACAANHPDVVKAASAAQLEMTASRWVHPGLSAVPSAKALAVLTTPGGGGTLKSLVFSAKAPSDWGASERDALDKLSLALPTPQPCLSIYVDGDLRLSVPLSGGGGPRLALARSWGPRDPSASVRSCAADGERDLGRELLEQEWRSIEQIAQEHGFDLGPMPAPLWSTSLPPGGAPHQRAGWFSHGADRLVMACGVRRAPRDAIASLALSRWCDQLSPGSSLSPDQLAFLDEIEGKAPVGRNGGTDVPLELPRAAAVRYGGSVERARAAFGTAAGLREMHEIRALGFDAICLEVHVPAVSSKLRKTLPFEFDAWAAGGHRAVTLEGDGAVLMAAEHARDAGLKVVLWPRILTGPSGGLLGHQFVATLAHWWELSERVRVTSMLIAELAEEMGADGLVLFDLHFLPGPDDAKAEGLVAEGMEARRSVGRAMLEGALVYGGPKVCVAESVRSLGLVQDAEAYQGAGVVLGLDLVAGLSGPAGNRKHDLDRLTKGFAEASATLGARLQMIQISVPGTLRARRGREPWGGATDVSAREEYLSVLIESLESAGEVPFIVARGWLPGGGAPRGYDVSRWPLASQRSLAAMR